jgi:hypothetical protein
VLYYAVIVTGQDIPAGTELTYDYQVGFPHPPPPAQMQGSK